MRRTKAEEYRARAAECERTATETRDPQAKADFTEAARQWTMMARQAERLGR